MLAYSAAGVTGITRARTYGGYGGHQATKRSEPCPTRNVAPQRPVYIHARGHKETNASVALCLITREEALALSNGQNLPRLRRRASAASAGRSVGAVTVPDRSTTQGPARVYAVVGPVGSGG